MANQSPETVSAVFLIGGQLAGDVKLALMNFSGKVFSQGCASAAKQTVKTVPSVFITPTSPG
jgi:hypothetical protein